MNDITTIGLDTAKSVFQVQGVDTKGETVLRRELKRRQMLAFFAKLPAAPCRDRSVWRTTLLVTRTQENRTYFAADLTPLRQTVCKEPGERRNGCRGDMRGSHKAEHALRANQDQ